MNYETIIGLEVHAQLLTRSKMYCRCSSDYASTPPNTHVCPVCLGMPGVLPVINRQAIEYAIMTALALNCTISDYTKFDRKNYPYPDLMKGYQISQFDAPVGLNGWLTIEVDGKKKRAGITRVHMEEDVAKLLHRSNGGEDYSLVDVNRSGTPLMEIVGEPDLRSPEEARQYLMQLRTILRYLGVSTGNMEEGSFRCDANISIRPENETDTLPRAEVKNMNSFRGVYLALEYEAKRQRQAAAEGKKLVQETRGWVEAKGKTVSQRSKEYAHDYRYFPEPDLPPLNISREWVEEIKAKMPELPEARRDRFMLEYSLPLYDAGLLTSSKETADYFEACVGLEGQLISKAIGSHHKSREEIEKLVSGRKESGLTDETMREVTNWLMSIQLSEAAKEVSNWLLGETSRILNTYHIDIIDFSNKVSPEQLRALIYYSHSIINISTAKNVLLEMFKTSESALKIITEQALGQISDNGKIEAAASQAIDNNPQAVADYRSGRETAVKFLVGQVMKATRGRANPQLVNEILIKKLN